MGSLFHGIVDPVWRSDAATIFQAAEAERHLSGRVGNGGSALTLL